jgi:hypothetical protein
MQKGGVRCGGQAKKRVRGRNVQATALHWLHSLEAGAAHSPHDVGAAVAAAAAISASVAVMGALDAAMASALAVMESMPEAEEEVVEEAVAVAVAVDPGAGFSL